MTNPNDPNSRREFPQDAEGSSFSSATWISLGFIVLLFAGVAFWAYQSGDMQEAANRPGVERKMPPATTGQSPPSSSGAPSTPATKDSAK